MESDAETALLASSDGRKGSTSGKPNDGKRTESDSRRSSRRLSGKPPLQRVDEVEQQSTDGERRRSGCPDYFGVKSYLHFFYDPSVIKDPSIYEDDDGFPFLNPRPRRARCRSIWWKIFVWIGANLLVFGILGILISYLLPRRPTEMLKGDKYEVLDTSAIRFNHNLDLCKLVSLIVFCVGGLTLIISLLFPSLLYHYCDESSKKDDGFKVGLLNEEPAPMSPIEMTVPATSKLQNVQPQRKSEEAIITQEGTVNFKD
ncbi:neurensin-1-like [Tubulanus polymorphus]|uniref:neurensin-1-like n=1 Tax=Tubulanus polymorphus TaxID=672921 RepID=UPI003DA4DFDD